MSPTPPPPPLEKALRASVEYAARSRAGLRAGLQDARAGSMRPPGEPEHARRFFYGLAAPLTLFRAAWRDPSLRRSMTTRLWPPLLAIALATTAGVLDLVQTLVAAHRSPTALAAEVRRDQEDQDDDDDDGDRNRDEPRGRRGHAMSKEDKAALAKAGEEARAAAAKAAAEARAKGGSGIDVAEAAIEAAADHVDGIGAARDRGAAADRGAPAPAPPSGHFGVLKALTFIVKSKLAKLLATLQVIEWILVWIGREHHDVIAAETAALTGVPSEPPPNPPRLRLDAHWLVTKGWRAVRFLIFLALAAPAVGLAGEIPVVGQALGIAIEAGWIAYFASVFAIANTPLAWEAPLPEGWAPWFVRGLRRLGAIAVVGLPFRLYARFTTVVTRGVWPACRALEAAPWESAGLALARAIASVPVLYILSRPMFTPAATHALLARAGFGRSEPPAPTE